MEPNFNQVTRSEGGRFSGGWNGAKLLSCFTRVDQCI